MKTVLKIKNNRALTAIARQYGLHLDSNGRKYSSDIETLSLSCSPTHIEGLSPAHATS
jgi:hypothetical protein